MNLTVLKAIRLKCLECSCGSRLEVSNCLFTSCPLWPYRMGRKLTSDEIATYNGKGEPVVKSSGRSLSTVRMMKQKAVLHKNGTVN